MGQLTVREADKKLMRRDLKRERERERERERGGVGRKEGEIKMWSI